MEPKLGHSGPLPPEWRNLDEWQEPKTRALRLCFRIPEETVL